MRKALASSAAPFPPQPLPALARLRKAVQAERTQCWLLVALLAAAFLLAGLGVVPVGIVILSTVQYFGSSLAISQNPMLPFESPLFDLSMLAGLAVVAVGPALVIAVSITTYNRHYRQVARDLVQGPVALMLMETEYATLVERAAAERYRPNPNRVNLGPDFLSHVNHFAHYYGVYYRMSYGPVEPRVPFTIERNCWWEGLLTALGSCTCGCGGFLLILPLAYRISVTWPKLVATKQAVLEYFSGLHDFELEGLYNERRPPA